MIICCGEALIDMLPRTIESESEGEDGRDAFLPVPGGALFNTAVALGRLGQDAGFVSGVSTDLFGRQLIDFLTASHVDSRHCARSANPTTLAFVTLTGGIAQYVFYDENTAGRMLDIDAIPLLPPTTQALHFGGISLIAEPCGTTYEELMRRHKDACILSLDPNIRPGFVQDEAAYRARLGRMIAMSDIVKVSQEDLDWLAPGEAFDVVAEDWLAAGVSIVTLTLGDEGARSITRDLDVTVAAPAVTVVDTVGAGDTFNAGFLAGLNDAGVLTKADLAALPRAALENALDYAIRVAVFTVTQAGANPPWKDQL